MGHREMIVYHGTDSDSAQHIIEDGIDLFVGDDSVDNGRGFYTTPSRAFASRRAKMRTSSVQKFRQNEKLRPVTLQIEIDESKFNELRVKEFYGCTYEWKEFVLYNRLGNVFLNNQGIVSINHNLDSKYDVVIDETADAGVGGVVSRIRYKETRSNMDINSVIDQIEKSNNRVWGRQVSFHSKRALKLCIQSIKAIEEPYGE